MSEERYAGVLVNMPKRYKPEAGLDSYVLKSQPRLLEDVRRGMWMWLYQGKPEYAVMMGGWTLTDAIHGRVDQPHRERFGDQSLLEDLDLAMDHVWVELQWLPSRISRVWLLKHMPGAWFVKAPRGSPSFVSRAEHELMVEHAFGQSRERMTDGYQRLPRLRHR